MKMVLFWLMVKQPSLIPRYSMAIPVRFVTWVSSRPKKTNLLSCNTNFVLDWINAALSYPTYLFFIEYSNSKGGWRKVGGGRRVEAK